MQMMSMNLFITKTDIRKIIIIFAIMARNGDFSNPGTLRKQFKKRNHIEQVEEHKSKLTTLRDFQ